MNPHTIPKAIRKNGNCENTDLLASAKLKFNANLPKLRIPLFEGKYNQWSSFYDICSAFIHENNTLSDREKLFYLKSNLHGEALKIFEVIPSTADNYHISLELLVERYNKKDSIIYEHMEAIFNIPSVIKDTAISLRSIISYANQHLRVLSTLVVTIENWDPLLINMLSQKLDGESRRAFEMHKSQVNKISLIEFYKFIDNGSTTLAGVEISDNHLNQKSRIALITTDKKAINKYKCPLCDENHYLYFCNNFKNYHKVNK